MNNGNSYSGARYSLIGKLGKDNFQDRKYVAIKRIKQFHDNHGVPHTTVREISLLRELSHHNVVQLTDVFEAKKKIWLVFEHLESDLRKYIRKMDDDDALSLDVIRRIMYQLLKGICYCHSRRVMHRDLKPANILFNSNPQNGEIDDVKICDFGLSRAISLPIRTYTTEVQTLWYRAPEILLGTKHYGMEVDIWSLGCIFQELVMGEPLFQGDSQIDMIMKIFQLLGTPTRETWDDLAELKFYNCHFPKWKGNRAAYYMRELGDELGIDLFQRMMQYDPKKRISAAKALKHPFFAELVKEEKKKEMEMDSGF